MTYESPPFRFGYYELEPYFSEEMVRHHHLVHHRAYTDDINRFLATLVAGFWLRRKK